MPLKRFNRQFSILTNTPISTIDTEAQLQGLLNDSISSMKKDVIFDYIEEIPTAVSNITQLFSTCEKNSVVFWKAVEMLEKMIAGTKYNSNVIGKSGLLPLLVGILLQCETKVDYLLELIEELTFVVPMTSYESYAQKVFKYIINILTDAQFERNIKLQKTALSVLINMCSLNAELLPLLSQEINLVDLQKRIAIDKYGILACKMNLVLHDCGHVLNEEDIRNFLKYTTKDLSRFSSLDEKTLKHLCGFLQTTSNRSFIAKSLQEFDFYPGLEAALQTMEQVTNSMPHTKSLLVVMQILLNAHNNSLTKLKVTLLNYALSFLKIDECVPHVLETVNSIFMFDTKISSNSFELDDLTKSLDVIINKKSRSAAITVALLKLLATLIKYYKTCLVEQKWLRALLNPLLQCSSPQFSKIHADDVSVYLQCLVTIFTLAEKPDDRSLLVFKEKNVQYLIGMAIKHGSAEQCEVALSLINKISPLKTVADVISTGAQPQDFDENTLLAENNQSTLLGKDAKEIFADTRINKVINNLEKSCGEGALNSMPATDFIDLYKCENIILKNKNIRLEKEVTQEKQNNLSLEAISLKWSELARSLQESNDLLLMEKEKSNAVVRNLKLENKNMSSSNKNTSKALCDERKRSRDLENRIKQLEDEISEADTIQSNIMMLMNKRKKGNM